MEVGILANHETLIHQDVSDPELATGGLILRVAVFSICGKICGFSSSGLLAPSGTRY
jgi:hypothetical protein